MFNKMHQLNQLKAANSLDIHLNSAKARPTAANWGEAVPLWLALKQLLASYFVLKAVPCVLAERAANGGVAQGQRQLEPLDRGQRFRNLATGTSKKKAHTKNERMSLAEATGTDWWCMSRRSHRLSQLSFI